MTATFCMWIVIGAIAIAIAAVIGFVRGCREPTNDERVTNYRRAAAQSRKHP